jgi:hypothetical protein
MKKKKKSSAAMESAVPFRPSAPSIYFDFPKDGPMKAPDGLKTMNIDDSVTVMVRGKVESLSKDKYSSSFRLRTSKVAVNPSRSPLKTMKEMMQQIKEERRS